MNDKIDVLAVMDIQAKRARSHEHVDQARALETARAAVAELIEVASDFDGYVAEDHSDTSLGDREDMWNRLSAAIARVKGE